MKKPRYLIGIDLGTTNTVVYYMDTQAESLEPVLFMIPQVTDLGEIGENDVLSSFLYLPEDKEVPKKALSLPWDENKDFSVGQLARKNASLLPGKVVSSAKSWLCVDIVDRLAPILPWNRDNQEKQISPVEASKRILEHIKNAWNFTMAKDNPALSLEKQTVILTVPASFDAVARELSVKAAKMAGFDVVLIEEPLAAFYSWLQENEESWRDQLSLGDVVLVCDIGGGTTDFSLIKVVDNEGNLGFERVAVGRHILLGGDNMDLTIAYSVAERLRKEKNLNLDNYQITGLTHACCQAKEILMSSEDAPAQKLTVLGKGSSVIGGTITAELTRDEINKIFLDGFFPLCSLDEKPVETKQSGLRTFGLNYEADPAITKHLASFLSKHASNAEDLPNCVFFNGGVTKAGPVRERIIAALQEWPLRPSEPMRVITGTNPDRAVAKGACCYANVSRGQGIRIKSGSSHSYYIGIEVSMLAVPGFVPPLKALCIVPLGMEEGTGHDIPYSGLGLIVGETTEFSFFMSTSRKDDAPGSLIENVDTHEEIIKVSSLTATLPVEKGIAPGSLVPINLRCDLTETGTLQIWCIGHDESKWKLEFELRSDERTNA